MSNIKFLDEIERIKNLDGFKDSNWQSINPDFVATGNVGCIKQISMGTKIPILHTIELLDWYTGGKKPDSIKS